MFTRTVEVTTKPGKAKELSNTINDKVLPILKKQVGFVDETVLVSDTEPNRGLAISFWNTKEDAERYHKEQYPAIHEMIRPLLDAEPVVRTFNVDSSTTHKIGRLAHSARTAFPKVDHQVRLAGRCPALCETESILRLPGSTAQRNLDAFAA